MLFAFGLFGEILMLLGETNMLFELGLSGEN